MSRDPSPNQINVNRETRIALPSKETFSFRAISCPDWERFKKRILRAGRPFPRLSLFYPLAFGVAGTGFFALLPLLCARGLAPWICPLCVSVSVFALLLGIILWQLDSALARTERVSLQDIIADMEAIEEAYETKLSAAEQDGTLDASSHTRPSRRVVCRVLDPTTPEDKNA